MPIAVSADAMRTVRVRALAARLWRSPIWRSSAMSIERPICRIAASEMSKRRGPTFGVAAAVIGAARQSSPGIALVRIVSSIGSSSSSESPWASSAGSVSRGVSSADEVRGFCVGSGTAVVMIPVALARSRSGCSLS